MIYLKKIYNKFNELSSVQQSIIAVLFVLLSSYLLDSFNNYLINKREEKIERFYEERNKIIAEKEQEEERAKKEKKRIETQNLKNLKNSAFDKILNSKEEYLFSKCNNSLDNDYWGKLFTREWLSDKSESIDLILSDSCTGVHLILGAAYYEANKHEKAKEHLGKTSCGGKEFIKNNNIKLTPEMLKEVEKKCDGEENDINKFEIRMKKLEREKVEEEFREKYNEKLYQFKKDYIKNN